MPEQLEEPALPPQLNRRQNATEFGDGKNLLDAVWLQCFSRTPSSGCGRLSGYLGF